MEPDGDPEARIRDLERPLAQQADASELGTRPYRPAPSFDGSGPQYRHQDVPGYAQQPPWSAPPPSGPQWGSPYYSPPQHVVRKSPRLLWVVPLTVLGVPKILSALRNNQALPDRVAAGFSCQPTSIRLGHRSILTDAVEAKETPPRVQL